ncbi:collagen beta-1,O-galactosyltransferase [Mytilus galloprovincialis]|uniref:Collagen beta-1,O-galactosyltransferase n=1 Tax=Mytilus galloprovincialis TaxID=29158 RepID=A0A8B6EC12_MYTGA|nr:collagen beta-1,O-galactosyltransferase [Mytilus galloprovincialis]
MEKLTCRCISLLFLLSTTLLAVNSDSEESNDYLQPTVTIAILIRNKAHVLPWFFGHLENLNYPKNRISLWIRSDHNVDDSNRILRDWLAAVEDQYHFVNLRIDTNTQGFEEETGPCDWTDERFAHVIDLRHQALEAARENWSDYLFMLDADVILENKETLSLLVQADKIIVGPMLNASYGQVYSNFWGAMTDEGYYRRVPEYFEIVDRKTLGCFPVPMVHTALLIDMHRSVSPQFTYKAHEGYKGPKDDIIIFAHSVKNADISMHILNTEYFGTVMIPLDEHNTLQDESDQFTYIKLEARDANHVDEVFTGRKFPVDRPGLIKTPHVFIEYPEPDKLGFDQVYMINLLRRPERRQRMLDAFKELGIQAKIIDAVDGKQLNDTYLDQLGIEMLPGFLDPYGKRPLTMGEIGCFLSHYFIWKDIEAQGYENVIIFEDDVRFEPYFKTKLKRMMADAERTVPNWDLIYVGRKRLYHKQEQYVEGTTSLVWPSYSYWTLSYIISDRGVKKLLKQNPLTKMVPVDEFLPIMFDKHPTTEWKDNFSPRDLVGLSADPLLAHPTHYTGEPNYFSDTEESVVIQADNAENNKMGDVQFKVPANEATEQSSKDEL